MLKVFQYIFLIILLSTAALNADVPHYLDFKYVLNQKTHKDSHVFGKNDLDDLLSNVKSVDGHQEHRIEVEMLQNALDLSETKLRECMIPRTELVCMSINTTIPELRKKFISTKLSKILIFKNNIDNIIGYVHSSELFRNPKNIRATLLPIPFVPESMSALELLSQFIENNKISQSDGYKFPFYLIIPYSDYKKAVALRYDKLSINPINDTETRENIIFYK